MLTLVAKKRDAKEDVAEMRKAGEIPAVFYGMGRESTSVAVSKIAFKKVWEQAGESTPVKISTPAGDIDVLIHEVQTNPVSDEPTHIDFLAIDMKKKVKVGIPLVFEGISEAVKGGLGILVKVLHEVEVEALPNDLPHNISVDISSLKTIQDVILVSSLKVPAGVLVLAKEDEVVASIAEQKEEKEEVSAPIDLSTIEVEKKGKKEEDGAEAAPAEEKK